MQVLLCSHYYFRGDAEYLDTYIKPELVRRVSEAFPQDFVNNEIARNQCRDKIIECVRYAHQVKLKYSSIFFFNCVDLCKLIVFKHFNGSHFILSVFMK